MCLFFLIVLQTNIHTPMGNYVQENRAKNYKTIRTETENKEHVKENQLK